MAFHLSAVCCRAGTTPRARRLSSITMAGCLARLSIALSAIWRKKRRRRSHRLPSLSVSWLLSKSSKQAINTRSAQIGELHFEHFGGVEHGAVPADGPVQMRACHAAGGATQAETLAFYHVLPGLYFELGEVHVEAHEALPVIDDDAIAFVIERGGEDNDACVAGAHHGA